MTVPPNIISGEYPIFLKPVDQGDLDFFFHIYGNQDVMRFIGKPLTRSQCEKQLMKTIREMSDRHPHHLTYVIKRCSDDANIGIIGLTWFKPENRLIAAIGVMISSTYRRQRMAHHAKQLMMAHGFTALSLTTIVAFCQADNVAANTANMRLNMQRGAVIEHGVHQKKTQEWIIEKTAWMGSYSG